MTIALMKAGIAMGVLQVRPNDNQDSLAREMKVNPANIAFMRERSDVIRQKSEAIAGAMQRLGVDDA